LSFGRSSLNRTGSSGLSASLRYRRAGRIPGLGALQPLAGPRLRLDLRLAALAGEEGRLGPARPGAGDRVVRVAVVPPADIGTARHVDRLGLVLAHQDLRGRDVAVAVLAI